MRIQIVMTDLDQERWDYLQRVVQVEYKIPADAVRVCLTFTYGEEERHAEISLADHMGLLMGLTMVGVGQRLKTAIEGLSTIKNEAAVMTPDVLPGHLEQVRNEADPARVQSAPCPDGIEGCEVMHYQTSQGDGAGWND